MDEKTAHLLEQLKKIPELSWETPQLLTQLNEEGVTLAELNAGIGEIKKAIELTDTHWSGTYRTCQKLAGLSPRTITDGIPIGF